MASLGKDLATIREHQQKTLQDVHDSTKIPLHILQGIEDGSIFTDFDENKTYVRSYVRSYGKALDISESNMIEALDHYELGAYDGQLLDLLSDDPKSPTFTYDDSDTDSDSIAKEYTEEEEPEQKSPPKPTETPSPKTPPRSSEPTSTSPSVNSVDWADMGHKFTPLENRSRIWIGIAVVFVVIASVLGYWFYQNSTLGGITDGEQPRNTTQNVTQPGIVPDSLQLELSTEDTSAGIGNEQQAQARESLSDTLNLLVYAAHDRLDPVRVYTDLMREFNPYWIERGVAYRFEFTDFIRIRGQYSRMELLMNGHPVENFRDRFLTVINPDSQYVELQRSLFEENDKWLQPPPDSTELGFSPPSDVLDRPRFPIVN